MAITPTFRELQKELGLSDIAATFADITHMSAQGANKVDVFSLLTQRIIEILPVSACGILLADINNSLQVVGSSDHSAHQLDLYQLQTNSGPCMQACSTGEVVIDTQLSSLSEWPNFAQLATSLGLSAVYAIPLAGHNRVLGALNLFSTAPLSDRDITVARILADTATLALLQADPHNDEIVVARNTAATISSRNSVEQAKGVLSQRYDIDMNAAFQRIQTVASAHHMGIVDLATAIANRTISDEIAQALNNAS